MRQGKAILLVLTGSLLTLGFILLIHGARALPRSYSPYRKLNIFARVLTYVENNYVEPVDEAKLIYGAVQGMMETLDPHSTFLTPEQYREMKAETEGEFGGIGIEVEIRNGWLTVVSPLEGTPAHRAGIRSGDEIRMIDGTSTRGMQMHQAVRTMRGPRGTRVKIVIWRPALKKMLQLEIVRDLIKIISVSSKRLESGIFIIRLKNFQESSHRQVQEAMEQMLRQGKLRGLILDLRNNPGGLLDEAVRVADLFLDQGLIVRTVGQGGKTMDEEKAHSRGAFLEFPMICLVNEGSASAAEIVAGALQDHRRAVVMGLRTFGKGSVQTIIELGDGSGLKLTIARYFTPNGRSIQEKGIQPDIIVEERAPAKAAKKKVTREKDLKRHLTHTGKEQPPPSPSAALDDFQLQSALGYIKAAEIFRQSSCRDCRE